MRPLLRKRRAPDSTSGTEHAVRDLYGMWGTQYSLCLSARRSPTAEIDRELEYAGKAGFSCVELWAPAMEGYLARYPLVWLDIQMKKHAIRSLVINGLDPLSIGHTEDTLVNQARFLELCTHLDTLGGGTIVLHPAAEHEAKEKRAEGSVRALRAYADLAAPFEVSLAFEFQANSTVPNLDAALDLIERAARSNLRLALSTHEWSSSEIEPHTLKTLESGRLALVHLDNLPALPQASSDPTQPPPPHDRPDLAGLCARLATAGFRGPYCIAPPSGSGTPLERAHTARQAAIDLLAPLYVKAQTH